MTGSDFLRRLKLSAGGLSLRGRLILLTVSSILPLLAFFLIGEYLDYRHARDVAGEQVLARARGTARAVESELRTRIAALQVLAMSGVLAAGDMPAFRERARSVADNMFPGANILLLDREGRQVMNLAVPPGQPLPSQPQPDAVWQVFETGRPAVSGLFFGAALQRLVVSIEVPVILDGTVVYVLALNPEQGLFADIIEQQRLPAGWVVSIFDSSGVIVGRVPNADQFVGHKASPSFLPHLLSRQEGTVESTSLEGIRLVSAFSHAAAHGWAVGIGMPVAALAAPVVDATMQALAAAAAAMAIGLVAAVLVARNISRPIGSLIQLSGGLSSGEISAEPRTGLRETDAVARTLYAVERHRRDAANEERRAQQALSASEEQLHQAHKLDAMGQLTGGVAHDFNNILTVIMGTSELLAERTTDAKLVADAERINRASRRGAALVAQLMAFARKQTLAPVRTDVNELIIEVVKLLRPTLGEDVEIESMLAADAWPAIIDPSQLSTAVLNLAVNARDAMPEGGKLTLETANAMLDEAYAQANPEVAPGPYVMIAISDTGAGMPPDILEKVYEPFFTTKPVGKGTGLGLSMVYGFVKQSGGHIKIYSEVALGTSIRLYLPRLVESEAEGVAVMATALPQGGNETILVVEDDPMVRGHVVSLLQNLGYRILTAEDGPQALRAVDGGAQFDLLFTDVIMPGGLNGRQLAAAICRRHGPLRVLYTSGYTEHALLHHGRLAEGVALLSKPYRKSDLAMKLREVLASAPIVVDGGDG